MPNPCKNCQIIIDQDTDQDAAKCALGTFGRECCNCLKKHHGWEDYEKEGCRHCKARAGWRPEEDRANAAPDVATAAEAGSERNGDELKHQPPHLVQWTPDLAL
eukprot:CAMPEP_0180134488 /NCGR_PEP_ID=MMETSP0986-20121125/10195_1 /TAXON_ID=697907 /ORGANISM="non described non described, Strain CCMP2293" /LENGTH=103 /DNA_ID=CAMNT_0022074865 /DNA_START=12 /DNA_END=323 /DNA_ORIENTATION=-